MRLGAALILALGSLLISPTLAFAHRPYFTEVGKIRLPNGELGEVRLLNGDGILGPDPVRAIVVNAEGRLLARSRKSISMALACGEEGKCLIFDFSAGKMLDLAPASFRQGPIVPGFSDHERNDLWDLEDGPEDWGFMPRSPSLGERLLGYRVMVESRWPLLILNAVVGLIGAFFAVAVIVIARTERSRYFERFMAALAILLILGMGLFLALLSGLFSMMAGLTLGLWLASLCLGAVLVLAGTLMRSLSRRTRLA